MRDVSVRLAEQAQQGQPLLILRPAGPKWTLRTRGHGSYSGSGRDVTLPNRVRQPRASMTFVRRVEKAGLWTPGVIIAE